MAMKISLIMSKEGLGHVKSLQFLKSITQFRCPKSFSSHYFVLEAEMGVLNWVLDADNYEHDPKLLEIRRERGYTYHVCEDDSLLLRLFVYVLTLP